MKSSHSNHTKLTGRALLLIPLLSGSAANAVIIYSEDFTGQTGKGALGAVAPDPVIIDTTGVDWTIDVSGAALTAISDFFEVRGDESFTGRDLDGPAFWSSPVISTTIGDTIDFSILTGGADATQFEAADTFIISYLVDGAPIALADLIPAVDIFNSGTITETGIVAGSTFQLQVEMQVNAGAEILTFDDIVVNAVPVPEPSSFLFLGLAGAAGLLRRRK